jgi:hypothetical protein
VLLLQGSRKSSNAQFPRIRAPKVALFTIAPGEKIQQVCQGERVSFYQTDQRLTERSCYPRPGLASKTQQPLSSLLKRFDFIVVSTGSKQKPNPDELAWLAAQPIQQHFARPKIKKRLSYPTGPIPLGDWGAWPEIRIYRRSE